MSLPAADAKHLLTQTVLYSASVFLSNVFHWLFAFTARRLTSNEAFAVIGVFSSLSAIGGYFAGAISQTIERYLSYYSGSGEREKAGVILRLFFNVAALVGIVLATVCLTWNQEIAQALGIRDARLVILFAPSLFLYFLLAYQRGVFKAMLRFDVVGAVMVLEGLVKILMLALAAKLGWSLAAIGASSVTVSLLASFIMGAVALRNLKTFESLPMKKGSARLLPRREIGFYSFNALLDNIGIGLLLQVDVLLANHYLPPAEAGLYATITFFGKIVFLSGSMGGPLILPITSFLSAKGRSGHREFWFLFAFTGLAGGAVVALFALFPQFMTHLFAGEHGYETIQYLPAYFLGIWMILMTQCISSYFQARKNFWISRLMIAGAVLLTVGIATSHRGVSDIVDVIFFVGSILFAGSLTFLLYVFRHVGKDFFRRKSGGETSEPQLFPVTLARRFRIIINTLFRTMNDSLPDSPLPKNFGDYVHVETLQAPTVRKPVSVAVYARPDGAKILAKIWHGSSDDYHRLALERESVAHELLGGCSIHLPESGYEIHIPSMVSVETFRDRVVLLREFIPGTSLAGSASSDAIRPVLWELAQSFDSFRSGLAPLEWSRFSRGSRVAFLVSYMVYFFHVYCSETSETRRLLRHTLWFFARGCFSYLCDRRESLVYRDIHPRNLIVPEHLVRGGKQSLSLIDLGEISRQHPFLEYASMITPESVQGRGLIRRMIREAKMIIRDAADQKVFRFILLVRSVALLGEQNLSPAHREKYLDLIRLTTQDDKWRAL